MNLVLLREITAKCWRHLLRPDDVDIDASLYDELRRLAGVHMAKERTAHTLQPTALAHEAFLVIMRQHNLDGADRSRFLAAAANTIRRILVDHARRKQARKRGGPEARRVPLNVSSPHFAKDIDVLALNEALSGLAEKNERAAKVVELKFFGGMTGEEIASELDISLRTVNSDWAFSKAWLYREIFELTREE